MMNSGLLDHGTPLRRQVWQLEETNVYRLFSLKKKKPSDNTSSPGPLQHWVILGFRELAGQGKGINESTRNLLNTYYIPNLHQVNWLKDRMQRESPRGYTDVSLL